ncbi:hypothetical protein BDP27DRAFT_1301213 [Rhodocollybia butyracea]|uniref:Uncharacterized protein n=1 Tax=Rhodocollybia butyracea TaxID=206335 RepID=A0A9P5U0G1_9AGAR|nr:hypothetical protein BDP27DRAFT_1301213 [Rhodocollybia butyracea]
MSIAERVVTLKEEGNRLFSQKDYASANAKYTEALELGGDDAILYSNRAACRLNLKLYLDAESDARMATNVDPGFAKAYARLATAQDVLRKPYKSVESWQKSIEKLPRDNLTPAQLNQKTEYEKGLATAQTALNDLMASGTNLLHVKLDPKEDFPWIRAKRMIPHLMHGYPALYLITHESIGVGLCKVFIKVVCIKMPSLNLSILVALSSLSSGEGNNSETFVKSTEASFSKIRSCVEFNHYIWRLS